MTDKIEFTGTYKTESITIERNESTNVGRYYTVSHGPLHVHADVLDFKQSEENLWALWCQKDDNVPVVHIYVDTDTKEQIEEVFNL